MQRQQTGGRIKALLIFGMSLIAATGAVFLVLRVVQVAQEEVQRAQRGPTTVDVVVALRDLNVGVPISDGDIGVRQLDLRSVPPDGVFTEVEGLLDRVPRERILANEVLRDERLALADAGVGLNALVNPGMRAMSVAVDAASGVAGFVQPGNWVDVIVTIRPDDNSQSRAWVSRAFLQGVRVLAVGRNMEGGKGEVTQDLKKRSAASREKATVTLELDLAQAEELALSATKGEIHLVLRNDIDITRVQTQGAMASAVIGIEPVARAAAPAPRRDPAPAASGPAAPVSEIISGDRVEEVQFEGDGTRRVEVSSGRRKR